MMAKVKICGITKIAEIQGINEIAPDFVGFVFADSRRYVDATQAALLRKHLDARIKVVGVFVNEAIDVIVKIHQAGIVDWVQLHGEEDDDYIRALKYRCNAPIIKAVCIDKQLPLLSQAADHLLFDSLSTTRGGSGMVFDWKVLESYQEKPYFLAGGLSCENIGGALDATRPFAVDVSSGVESKGIKDLEKIATFVATVRRKQR